MTEALPEGATLSVLYRDEDLVVVAKPAKLLVHRNEWAERDEPFALQQVRDLVGQHVYLVHRLDRATSGVLVFALGAEAARLVSAEFAERRVEKRYLAVVRGHPADHWVEDRPLSGERGEQPAYTTLRTLHRAEVQAPVGRYASARYAVVECAPRTGRRHQLRRHLAGANHPIVGDVAHGDRHHNRFFRERFGVDRLLLHAAQLRLAHPRTGDILTLRAPVEGSLREACVALGWQPQPHADPDWSA